MNRYLLFNRSRGTTLAFEVRREDSPWGRMRGLLGCTAEEFTPGWGLWLVPACSIHTVGMSFSIDVLYLNSEHRVIHCCHGLAPFRIAPLKWRARSIVELPAGVLEVSGTTVGDQLQFQPEISFGRASP